jgi:hypothetical protein
VDYLGFLPGAIAAVAMTVRIVTFFTVEQRNTGKRNKAV